MQTKRLLFEIIPVLLEQGPEVIFCQSQAATEFGTRILFQPSNPQLQRPNPAFSSTTVSSKLLH